MITLTDLCRELNNWNFYTQVDDIPKIEGTYTISGGAIDLSALVEDGLLVSGQYFRIIGSALNDGVYSYPANGLESETFNGWIWCLKIPAEVVNKVTEINNWLTANQQTVDSPFQSESFGGYSYTKAAKKGGSGGAYGWQDQFSSFMNKWRKVCPY